MIYIYPRIVFFFDNNHKRKKFRFVFLSLVTAVVRRAVVAKANIGSNDEYILFIIFE